MPTEWPYPILWDQRRSMVDIDVLVLGGGVAGSWAAIGAARAGAQVTLLEKATVIRGGPRFPPIFCNCC